MCFFILCGDNNFPESGISSIKRENARLTFLAAPYYKMFCGLLGWQNEQENTIFDDTSGVGSIIASGERAGTRRRGNGHYGGCERA
jgi:hypothetical protein